MFNQTPRGVLKKAKTSFLILKKRSPGLDPGTNPMTSPIQFIKEAKAELTKVVWPSRQETIRITLAVIGLSVAVAVFLGAVDFGLTKLFEWILNR